MEGSNYTLCHQVFREDGRTYSNTNQVEPEASHEQENGREADTGGEQDSADVCERVSRRMCSRLQFQTHWAS